jgi:hypothetical protein
VEVVSGVLVVDKPAGPTSFAVVARVKRALRADKAGHTGTLDPAATGVLAVGMALVAWGAPTHTEAHRAVGVVISVIAGLSALAFAPFALRSSRFDGAALAILGSAFGFAAGNVATKLMSDEFNADHEAAAVAWVAVAAVTGIAAIVTEMTALQRAKATIVVPVSFAVQTFLPIVLEPLFLREQWASARLDGVPIAAGLVVAAAGTTLVARARAVSTLIAAGSGG